MSTGHSMAAGHSALSGETVMKVKEKRAWTSAFGNARHYQYQSGTAKFGYLRDQVLRVDEYGGCLPFSRKTKRFAPFQLRFLVFSSSRKCKMQTNGQISPPSIPAAWRKACCVTFVFFFLASHGRLSHSYTARVLSNIHTYIYYIFIFIRSITYT